MIMIGKPSCLIDSPIVSDLREIDDTVNTDTIGVKISSSKELSDFLVQNIVYPFGLKEKSSEDAMILQLTLDGNGKVKESKILEAEIPEMEQEIFRVTKLLPNICIDNKQTRKTATLIMIPISFRMLKL